MYEPSPAYIAWLKEQLAVDGRDRAQGLSPLPRSKEERLAMYYALPLEKRRARRNRALWRDYDEEIDT